MKFKFILFNLLAGLCAMVSCNDELNSVGMGIQPDQDAIGVYADTFRVDASTVKIDSIYAKTINGYLGELYDPLYGTIKSGYVCQFYPSNTFPDTVINNKIDYLELKIFYHTFIGDSLAPMEVSVFPVKTALDKNYYTNLNPANYCDLNTVYGKKAYTARNLNVSDSLYFDDTTYKIVSVRLPDTLGQQLYNEFKKPAPNAFSSPELFVKFFPGLYLTTTYGTGCMLPIDLTYIYTYYKTVKKAKDVNGNDSAFVARDSMFINLTKEVIQLNSFKNANDEHLLKPNNERTYIKTPSGIFTKITIPIPEIAAKVKNRNFTSAKFSLKAESSGEWDYALSYPITPSYYWLASGSNGVSTKMLLISPDSVKTFFEQQRVADQKTAYTTSFNVSSYAYNFSNISTIIQQAIKDDKTKNLELLVIPVNVLYYSSQSTGRVDFASYHYLGPSGVSLKKGMENLNLQMITTDPDASKPGK